MKIAVYDNDYKSSAKLKSLLYLYSDYKKADFVVDVFADCNEIFNFSNDYPLIFLSIENEYGKKAAIALNKKERSNKTVVMGGDSRLAAEGFKVNAFNFLQKPFLQSEVFEILEKFFTVSHTVLPLLISTGSQNLCLNICDILYLEANNKHSIIHLKNQTVICNKTMARVFEVLPKSNFSKINRAYVVNLHHISSFSSENVVLSNKEILHPSRHFYKSFKNDYLHTQNPKIP